MALTTYSPAAIIVRALDRHAIPRETFCGIVGCSTGMMSEYLGGKRPLPNALAEQWLQTIKTIDRFVERLNGVPVNWHPRCADRLKNQLYKFERGLLLVSVVDLSPDTNTSDEIARAASILADAMAALSGIPKPEEIEKTEVDNVATRD